MKEIKFKPRIKLKREEIRMYILFISIQVKVWKENQTRAVS